MNTFKEQRVCKQDGCGRVFEITEQAPHKKFCSQDCRIAFHNSRRKAALSLLSKEEHQEDAQQGQEGE